MTQEPDEKGVGCFAVMMIGLAFWAAIIFGIVHFILF